MKMITITKLAFPALLVLSATFCPAGAAEENNPGNATSTSPLLKPVLDPEKARHQPQIVQITLSDGSTRKGILTSYSAKDGILLLANQRDYLDIARIDPSKVRQIEFLGDARERPVKGTQGGAAADFRRNMRIEIQKRLEKNQALFKQDKDAGSVEIAVGKREKFIRNLTYPELNDAKRVRSKLSDAITYLTLAYSSADAEKTGSKPDRLKALDRIDKLTVRDKDGRRMFKLHIKMLKFFLGRTRGRGGRKPHEGFKPPR
jgi:hypothetical protein